MTWCLSQHSTWLHQLFSHSLQFKKGITKWESWWIECSQDIFIRARNEISYILLTKAVERVSILTNFFVSLFVQFARKFLPEAFFQKYISTIKWARRPEKMWCYRTFIPSKLKQFFSVRLTESCVLLARYDDMSWSSVVFLYNKMWKEREVFKKLCTY